MMFKIVTVAIIFMASLSTTVQSVWADTSLSGDEIHQLISGNTAIGERRKKQVGRDYLTKSVMFKTFFNENGQLVEKGDAADAATASAVPAHGSWKVIKDKLCFTFSDSLRNKGKEMCRKVIHKDDNTYELTKKGKVNRVWKEILSGNPENLE